MTFLHMKKYLFLPAALILVLLLTYRLLFCMPAAVPVLTPFINLLTPEQISLLDLKFYYSLPHPNHVRCYTLKDDALTLLPTHFISYTEGFMSLKRQQSILKCINAQMPLHTPLNYFYNDYADNDYEIVASIGNLSQIYFIDQTTYSVKVPISNAKSFEAFYLNHIVRKGNIYYLLGDLVGDYKGICYTIDAASLKVLDVIKFPTSPFTIYKEQSSLNTEGHIFFTTQEGLIHISPAHATKEFIKLNFTPSYLVSQGSQTVALCLNAATLQYAQLDTWGKTIATGELLLPEDYLLPIKATLEGDFLTLLTYSPSSSAYTNYLLIYNLASRQLIYCCSLQNIRSYIALDFEPIKYNPIYTLKFSDSEK